MTEISVTYSEARLAALAQQSVAVIEAGQAVTGAYVASPTFPVYRYCWFRDGSFIADAMSRAGRPESADAFFAWCGRVLEAREDRIDHAVAHRSEIERDELLHCRYTIDGKEAPEEWWNFQTDGYGSWLWALVEHARRSGGNLARFGKAIDLTVRYLAAFWESPSYDWWEEYDGERHTSTLASIYGGLCNLDGCGDVTDATRALAASTASAIAETISRDGATTGHLNKWVGGDSIDASLVVCATPFRVFPPGDPIVASTVAAIERELDHGGVHRYPHDTYYGGGEWLLLAALLGWHYAEVGRVDDAWTKLTWVAAQANERGELPEQTDGCLLAPEFQAEWIERWGPSARPLLWSHAMFLTLAIELGAVTAPVAAAA
jgi:GH15 family glucan-1,4-alpha-glucosidase